MSRTFGMTRRPQFSAWSGLLLLSAACVPMTTLAPPADCTDITGLFPAQSVLSDTDHSCRDWLDATHGRVARSRQGSAVIWTRRTLVGTAVMVSAMHTLRVGSFGTTGTDVPATFHFPATRSADVIVRLVDPDGLMLSDGLSPAFWLFNPFIPADRHVDGFFGLPPGNDFYLAAVDSQRLQSVEDPSTTINNEPPELYDPTMATTSTTSFAGVTADELVLILGYPTGLNGPFGLSGRSDDGLYASVGRVLSDAEAVDAVAALHDAGDEEGDIDYDSEAEMFIEGSAAPGMSGGGVFDPDNILVGIIVRVTEAQSLPTYVRAIRMTHVQSTVQSTFDDLTPEGQAAVGPFLETVDRARH